MTKYIETSEDRAYKKGFLLGKLSVYEDLMSQGLIAKRHILEVMDRITELQQLIREEEDRG